MAIPSFLIHEAHSSENLDEKRPNNHQNFDLIRAQRFAACSSSNPKFRNSTENNAAFSVGGSNLGVGEQRSSYGTRSITAPLLPIFNGGFRPDAVSTRIGFIFNWYPTVK
jgi:hypothetical protein